MNSKLNVALICQVRGLLNTSDVLCLYFDMFYLGVCTTRHWCNDCTGQLVQELNVCSVCVLFAYIHVLTENPRIL